MKVVVVLRSACAVVKTKSVHGDVLARLHQGVDPNEPRAGGVSTGNLAKCLAIPPCLELLPEGREEAPCGGYDARREVEELDIGPPFLEHLGNGVVRLGLSPSHHQGHPSLQGQALVQKVIRSVLAAGQPKADQSRSVHADTRDKRRVSHWRSSGWRGEERRAEENSIESSVIGCGSYLVQRVLMSLKVVLAPTCRLSLFSESPRGA